MRKNFAPIFLLILGLIVATYLLRNDRRTYTEGEPIDGQETVFACPQGRSIQVGFAEGVAVVDLSDGRRFALEQAPSASGARYTNEGETIIFWTKDESAFLEEGGIMTYRDCTARK
jgi:membrane-bound inhibitor of C-type lysozyme